jgi:hypothetical protein
LRQVSGQVIFFKAWLLLYYKGKEEEDQRDVEKRIFSLVLTLSCLIFEDKKKNNCILNMLQTFGVYL